ncbi:MAG: 3-isopropylmalate dehydratase small subunit [Brevinematales bacterium]
MRKFEGEVLFLDRSDINTDEIIPAKYLTEITKEALKPYCLEDLKLEGFDSKRDLPGKSVIITRANFGCGSSREHAPWALEVNGIYTVIAENFARIFRQNMFNGGMLAIELSREQIDEIFREFGGKKTYARISLDPAEIVLEAEGKRKTYGYAIGGFEKALIEAGGWVGYAEKHY